MYRSGSYQTLAVWTSPSSDQTLSICRARRRKRKAGMAASLPSREEQLASTPNPWSTSSSANVQAQPTSSQGPNALSLTLEEQAAPSPNNPWSISSIFRGHAYARPTVSSTTSTDQGQIPPGLVTSSLSSLVLGQSREAARTQNLPPENLVMGVKVDIGYTSIVCPFDELKQSPIRTRLCLAFCPCFIHGPKQCFGTYRSSGAIR